VHGLLSSGRHRRASSIGTGKLALKLGLCVCAGQLIAGPAFAQAAQAAPVVKTATTATTTTVTPKVTESVNTHSIKWGSSVKVTAKVINPATGKAVTSGSVRLQAWRNHAWQTWQTKKLAKSGAVTFTTSPHVTGTYRTLFTGTSTVKSKASNQIKVTVKHSGAQILAEAKSHTGALYKFAAAGPKRFDCSGYTLYVYRKAAGKSLPHKANSQQKYGKAVSKSKKQVGDLIVFRSGSYGYHAAVYAGGGYIYDSPHSGARVGKHKIWSSNYVVRRLV